MTKKATSFFAFLDLPFYRVAFLTIIRNQDRRNCRKGVTFNSSLAHQLDGNIKSHYLRIRISHLAQKQI